MGVIYFFLITIYMGVLFVISRYKEDITWSKDLKKVIYDKSKIPVEGSVRLLNVGREGDTYIRYIINNYDKLEEYTVFLQGNPFDHIFINGINYNNIVPRPVIDYHNFQKSEEHITPFYRHFDEDYSFYYTGLHLNEYFQLMFIDTTPDKYFVSNGQFIVHKKLIQRYPVQFYIKLLYMLNNGNITNINKVHNDNIFHPNKINAWILERLWFYIFNSSFTIRPGFYSCASPQLKVNGSKSSILSLKKYGPSEE